MLLVVECVHTCKKVSWKMLIFQDASGGARDGSSTRGLVNDPNLHGKLHNDVKRKRPMSLSRLGVTFFLALMYRSLGRFKFTWHLERYRRLAWQSCCSHSTNEELYFPCRTVARSSHGKFVFENLFIYPSIPLSTFFKKIIFHHHVATCPCIFRPRVLSSICVLFIHLFIPLFICWYID